MAKTLDEFVDRFPCSHHVHCERNLGLNLRSKRTLPAGQDISVPLQAAGSRCFLQTALVVGLMTLNQETQIGRSQRGGLSGHLLFDGESPGNGGGREESQAGKEKH